MKKLQTKAQLVAPRVVRSGVRPLVLAGLLGGLALLAFHDPSRSAFYPPCLFRAATGFFCPGCGTARALHHLLHGRALEAVRYNALFVAALPFAAWVLAREARGGKRLLPPAALWALALLVVLFGVLRNVPLEPFTRLAPP